MNGPAGCRLCLNPKGPYINVLDDDNRHLLGDIKRFYNVDIVDGDPYTKIMCVKCLDKLISWQKTLSQITINQKYQEEPNFLDDQ